MSGKQRRSRPEPRSDEIGAAAGEPLVRVSRMWCPLIRVSQRMNPHAHAVPEPNTVALPGLLPKPRRSTGQPNFALLLNPATAPRGVAPADFVTAIETSSAITLLTKGGAR